MFIPGHWALAFINSLEREGADIEEGIETLRVLASWAKGLPGMAGGSTAAEKAEALIRGAMADNGKISPAGETAIRFLALGIRKNKIRHFDAVIEGAKKLLDKKRGIVPASIEYAMPPGGDLESRIKEAIKNQAGAAGVELSAQLKPELIGGYILRIGDLLIDASVRRQIRELETSLAAGISGDGGN